jgi:hypothetical protein
MIINDLKKTVYVAAYRNVASDYVVSYGSNDPDLKLDGYVRISDLVAVEFAEKPRAEQVADEVAILDGMRAGIAAQYSAKLAAIDAKRASLLSITQDVQP